MTTREMQDFLEVQSILSDAGMTVSYDALSQRLKLVSITDERGMTPGEELRSILRDSSISEWSEVLYVLQLLVWLVCDLQKEIIDNKHTLSGTNEADGDLDNIDLNEIFEET